MNERSLQAESQISGPGVNQNGYGNSPDENVATTKQKDIDPLMHNVPKWSDRL